MHCTHTLYTDIYPLCVSARVCVCVCVCLCVQVLLAEHHSVKRLFALKIVPKAKINTDKQVEQIKAEVRILR